MNIAYISGVAGGAVGVGHFELHGKPSGGGVRGTISRQSEWLQSKSLQAINAGEGVEKREPSYIVGGKTSTATMESPLGSPSKWLTSG